VAHDISMKFGLWTFHTLSKRQKNFDFIDLWLPYLWHISTYCTTNIGIMTLSP